ncbi:hypothetical protein CHS0354_015253 [Potamilus streckersoni]|uniref:Uncharacterized protein n=1 Tax=Potamilus streckersoni TaxID=2493646 RepID=A0AAE0RRB2_9BIVA|nr:hypothetical protein CHS0354_015253 [Potamilus streckersoni]
MKVTVPKLNNHEEKVTVHKLYRCKDKDTVLDLIHHEDEINVPNVELNTIAVQEVEDTKNKERNKRCISEILATFTVALVVFVTVAITFDFYFRRNIRTCPEVSALKTYKAVKFEFHGQKVTLSNNEEKYGIPECDKAAIDFEMIFSME